ncbi:hypothetical protein Tco_0962631 [Tanacetum coccineum]
MPTKIELTLEQSQQGVSDDVLNHKMIAGIEERRHGPSDAMRNPSQPFEFLSKKLISFFMKIHTSYALSWKPCQGDSLNLPDHRSYALSWKPCQGDSLNLPDHRFRRRCYSLIPVKSDS